MQFQFLSTLRLNLRMYTPEVLQHIFTHYTEQELWAFFGATTEEQFLKEMDMQQQGRTMYNLSFCGFHLIEKESERVIGKADFYKWYVNHHRAELGYTLFYEECKNKGFMTEALTAIIDYGFNTLNLHRIEAFVAPFNVPSLSLMRHFNFREEGLLREHYFYEGNHEDSLVFGLLKSDYLADKRVT